MKNKNKNKNKISAPTLNQNTQNTQHSQISQTSRNNSLDGDLNYAEIKKAPKKITVQMFERLAKQRGITFEELLIEGLKAFIAMENKND